jgi:hypothetical protein
MVVDLTRLEIFEVKSLVQDAMSKMTVSFFHMDSDVAGRFEVSLKIYKSCLEKLENSNSF